VPITGILLNAAIHDAILFSFQTLLLIYISVKRHKGFERYFIFVYGLISFSAYNIYIKFIQDYNIPIARTALFKIKFIGPMYLIDLLYLSILIMLFLRYIRFSKFKIFPAIKINLFFYSRDILLYLISIFSYLYYVNHGFIGDNIAQLRPIRGLILAFVLIWSSYILVNKIKSFEQAKHIIYTIVILDFINLISQIISARFFSDYLWQRGWHDVILLNQGNSMAVLWYLPLIVFYKKFGKTVALFGLLFLGIMLYDYVKGLYFLIPLLVFFYFLAGVSVNRINIKLFLSLLAIAPLVLYMLVKISQDKAIGGTRLIQVNSYMAEIKNNMTVQLIGSGFGGKYAILKKINDGGEMKKCDKDANSIKQIQFQVPIVLYYKLTGVVGSTVVAIFFLFSILIFIKYYKCDKMISVYILIAIIIGLLDPPFLTSSGTTLMFYEKLFFMILLLEKLNKLKLIKGEKICMY
jgi:hypothetical protein